jgi:hypothetical protein
MPPATVRASNFGGNASEPAGVTAETGIKFNREDSQTGTTGTIPIPTATGTEFSWIKNVALEVTSAASPATTISNRRVAAASGPSTGLALFYKAAAYAQPASGNMPASSGSNGNTPAGYTALTSYAGVANAASVYDSSGVSGGSTGRNGSMIQLVLGVDFTYTGGAGSAIALPNVTLTYDEA